MNGKYDDNMFPINGKLIQAAEPVRVGEPSPEYQPKNPWVRKDGSMPSKEQGGARGARQTIPDAEEFEDQP